MNQRSILRSVLIAVLSLVATTATAHDFEVNGIYYNHNGTGKVSVTFKGSSYNEYANEYTGDVVIPSSVRYSGTTYSVTLIDDRAFQDCSSLTSVTIGNSVTEIGYYAFSGCSGLTSVTIGNSVTLIGVDAFYYCSGLTSVTIPNSVTLIGFEAFRACSGLTSVTIPNSVTSIGYATFAYCSGLTSVTIPNSVTSIGYATFAYCSGLTSVTIPNSVTSIGQQAFEGCSGLTSVTIPNSVTSIGKYAFRYCSGLTSVISKAITPPTCGDDVFSTETYSVPLIVPSVAKEAYQAVSTWSNFSKYAEPERKITAIEFGASTFGVENGETLQLSATVTPEDATFADVLQWISSNPEVATVDDNGLVTAIAKGDAEIKVMTCDGSNLSASCTIKVAEATANNFEVGGIYYNRTGDGTVEVTFKGSSYDEYTNEYRGDVVIPSSVTYSGKTYSVTSIGFDAFFGCRGLTSVTIPNSVTSIGWFAFWDCSGLTSVTIPNSVTSIGEYAFAGCSGLTRVDISSLEAWLGIKFAGGSSNPLSYAKHLYLNGEEVKDLVIPNSVSSIGEYAFYECSSLTSVTIGNSVTSIGQEAFYGCNDLTSVTIGNSVTSIGDKAFFGCSGLTSVISKAITPPTCGSDAFSTETYSVPLIVPSVAKEAYKAAEYWSNFSNYAEPERKITAIEFGASTFGVGHGETLQLTAKVTPEDATFADVLQWTSSDEDVATVDGNGVVTAIANGTATITAQTVDGSKLTATCVVTVGTGAVEGVETNAARIYSANGNIIIAAAEDGEAAVYDFTGRLIKSVPVVAGDNTAVPVMPGYYIVRTGVKTQSVVVK